jgi:glycosyltransferase involved in cell wall biosynthesis
VRILVVHNRYGSALPSGENLVVDDEVAALRDRGHQVSTYFRSSDEIATWPKGKQARNVLTPIRSRIAEDHVAAMIDRDSPEVMHVHNLYPLISPSVIKVARSKSVPVVQTVHNHRHVCVKGTYFRDGHVCRDCLGARFPVPAIRHACYRDSHVQSALMATSHAVNRPIFDLVDRYIALTDEVAAHLRDYGVPTERIAIKPNSVPDPGAAPDRPDGGFAFVGRLSEEKGIELLCGAWRRLPDGMLGDLSVFGDGPLRYLVDDLAAARSDVHVAGAVQPAAALNAIRSAAIVVIPSTCPDVFPRVAVESLASGRPILTTAVGGLPSIVDPTCGWTCEATEDSLAATLAAASRTRTSAHSAAARDRYERLYTPSVVHGQLEHIYRSVIHAR